MSTNPNPFTLEGKTILITGGAGGIGSATARACVAMGARVVGREEAKMLVKIEYEPLEPVRNVQEAMAPGAPLLHENGNLCQSRHVTRGDAKAALKNGAKDFLAAAAERGIPMAVASANYPGLLDAAFRRLGIDGYFRTVLTPGEQLAGKHAPDIYLEAARLLGCVPCETAVIEDALHAAETAKAAGFYTVGFRDVSSRQDWDALAAICDRVTDSWDALRSGGFLHCF